METPTTGRETTPAVRSGADAGSAALAADVMDWLAFGERGISSETMLAHFEGLPPKLFSRSAPCHPLDNSDFRRCVQLLNAVPRYRERLDELRTLGGPWPGLVDNWQRFEGLLQRQLEGDKAAGRELYDSMKALGC